MEVLPTLNKILPGADSYRSVERFRVQKDHTTSLLVFNQHQPASDKRRFKQSTRIRFCKEVLRAGVAEHCANQTNIGFIIGGDANCSRGAWGTAVLEDVSWRTHFDGPQFAYATEAIADNPALMKPGDCQVGIGKKGFTIICHDHRKWIGIPPRTQTCGADRRHKDCLSIWQGPEKEEEETTSSDGTRYGLEFGPEKGTQTL